MKETDQHDFRTNPVNMVEKRFMLFLICITITWKMFFVIKVHLVRYPNNSTAGHPLLSRHQLNSKNFLPVFSFK